METMVALDEARHTLRRRVLGVRVAEGHWIGELSSSALSTATAVTALRLARGAGAGAAADERLVRSGLDWLEQHQNDDGGYGDTPDSPSNVSTTTLAWVALGLEERRRDARAGARRWLVERVGAVDDASLAHAIAEVYGEDRTFAAPILVMCALGGVFGRGRQAWRTVPAIPFELAALPRELFHRLGLPMVSYALPALIAIGQVVHHARPSRNPLARALRGLTRRRTLAVLDAIQPPNGGFLEATPLTSFVAMSLVGCGAGDHPVLHRALAFLRGACLDDGSWPIDTNLATWVTSLAVDALNAAGALPELLPDAEREALRRFLLDQQGLGRHPYTGAAAGGFAWTDLPGGVPDADDTAGALLALHALGRAPLERVAAAVTWLLDLANRDGGVPTFCRGWGKLPFDRSSPDITAHALRAWRTWEPALEPALAARVRAARSRAAAFLARSQRADGAWLPLWFGNQGEERLENPLYGTARVLQAAAAGEGPAFAAAVARGEAWLLAAQHEDGGFGGAPGLAPTVEETGLAVRALAELGPGPPARTSAVARGTAWLAAATARPVEPSPIGLYFAKLWYSERLYPDLFALGALERALA
jgi:squalene-hopene/tetraprenyl-beta-curcumene cyclase